MEKYQHRKEGKNTLSLPYMTPYEKQTKKQKKILTNIVTNRTVIEILHIDSDHSSQCLCLIILCCTHMHQVCSVPAHLQRTLAHKYIGNKDLWLFVHTQHDLHIVSLYGVRVRCRSTIHCSLLTLQSHCAGSDIREY